MSLLDSIMGTVSERRDPNTPANPLVSILGTLLTQSGGIQGLANKFSQAGLGNVFSSWVGTGANQPISGSQISQALGAEQINALAAKLGIDPAQVSQLMAEHLPQVVDQLTPEGKIDPALDHGQELASMLPSLLQKLTAETATSSDTQP